MASFQMLMDVLEEIYQFQLEIIDIAKDKKEALINGTLDELAKLIQLESKWIKKISKLEERRIEVVKDYFKDQKDVSENLTITELVNYVKSPKEKEKIKDINQRLKQTLQEIQQLNDTNTQLIEQSLEFISHTFSMLTEEPNQAYTYSKPSTKQNTSSRNRGVIDKKA